MIGWHWIRQDRTLRTGEIVQAGRVYRAEGPLVMCENGVHASRRALDALAYAPGPIICRVALRGEIVHDTDKSVARERRVLWLANATTILHEFAVTVATEALHRAEARGESVDPRLWRALDVKQRWLRGLATNEELDAAGAAARDAAGAAAGAAAGDATRDAARDAQNTMLETMLLALAPSSTSPGVAG